MKHLTQMVWIGLFMLLFCPFVQAQQKPVQVYILAGQSNMEGKAKVSLLQYQIGLPEHQELLGHLHEQGQLKTRDDVFVRFHERSGPLTAGFGSPDRIGPELEFGFVMGDKLEAPVLLIKTAWGGKSLYVDFRPPSAPPPDAAVLERELENARKSRPETTEQEIRERYGHFYHEMIAEVENTLKHIDQYVPDYNDRGYELAGFVWFQGWNDMINDEYTAQYTDNLTHLIRDVRRDLNVAELPVVVGVMGVDGKSPERANEKRDRFKAAQTAVGDLPEFKNNVAIVQTDQYWDEDADAVFRKGWKENLEEWEKVGSDYPYHYLGSARCHVRMGRAFADAMLKLKP
jgi:alpha-galactosidase